MQNIKELRESLTKNYESIKNGELDLKVAKELTNTAGKIINSLKVELEYNHQMGYKKPIDFLEDK